MSIVLPLVFRDAKEAQAFMEALRDPASDAAQLLAMPAALKTPVHVVSTSRRVVQAFESAGFPALRMAPPAEEQAPGMAPGAAKALRLLVHAGRVAPEEVVAVGDALNFHIEAPQLLQTLLLGREARGATWATFSEVRDHPVQLHLPFRLYALDMLALADPTDKARELLARVGLDAEAFAVSRPFPLDWRGMDIWESAPSLYAAAPERHSAMLRLWPVDSARCPLDESGRLYLWEGPTLARRVVPRSRTGPQEQALFSAFASRSTVPLRLASAGDGGWLCQLESSALPPGSRLSLWSGSAQRLGALEEVVLPGECPCAQDATAPLPTCATWPAGAAPDVLLACIVAPALGPEYDFTEPVCGGEELWELDPRTGQRVHPTTRKPFANRQDFPKLFQMSGAIAAGTVRALLDMPCGPLPRRLPLEPRPRLVPQQSTGADGETAAEGCGPEVPAESRASVPFGEWGAVEQAIHRLTEPLPNPRAAEEAFTALELVLEDAYWKYAQLDALAQRQAGSAPRHGRMAMCAGICFGKLDGLRTHLRDKLLARRQQHFRAQDAARAGQPAGARPSRLRQLPLPGAKGPLNPCHLASDDTGVLFISCMDFDWNAKLFRKDLDSGELRELCGSERVYSGLWFDPAQQVLYATLRRLNGRDACAIDALDTQGRCLSRHPILTRAGAPRFAPTLLSGDADHLYFIDAPCKTLVVIDKASRQVADLQLLPHAELNWDVVPGNGGLYTSSPLRHNLQRFGPDCRLLTRNSDMHTVYPRLLCVHPGTGEVFSLQIDRQPVALEELDQCVNIYTPSLSFVSGHAIDSGTAIDIHIMSARNLMVVADYVRGLRLYDIGTLGQKNGRTQGQAANNQARHMDTIERESP